MAARVLAALALAILLTGCSEAPDRKGAAPSATSLTDTTTSAATTTGTATTEPEGEGAVTMERIEAEVDALLERARSG